jgi:hypothetical protein
MNGGEFALFRDVSYSLAGSETLRRLSSLKETIDLHFA